MDLLIDSFFSAILLVISLDAEMVSIVGVSLQVSSASTLLAAVIGIPIGFTGSGFKVQGSRLRIRCAVSS